MKKRVLSILLCALILVAVASCSKDTATESNTQSPASETTTTQPGESTQPSNTNIAEVTSAKDTLTVAYSGDRGTLDFYHNGGGTQYQMIGYNVMEQLLDFNLATGEPVWLLATSIEEISPIKWHVHLREGVTFSNGNPFTAQDVWFTLNYVNVTDGLTAPVPNIIYDDMNVIDDYTIEFNFTHYEVTSLSKFSTFVIYDEESFDEELSSTNPIGTGAYYVTEYVINSHVYLEARDDYWGGKPKIQHLIIRCLAEDAQKVNGITTETVDVVSVPRLDIEYVMSLDNYQTEFWPSHAVDVINFNVAPGQIMDDPAARRAVCYAIDRETVLDLVYYGYGDIPEWPLANSLFDFEPEYSNKYDVYSHGYDPDLSRQLLEELGLTGKEFIIITNGSADYVRMAEIIQQNLRDVGLDAKINNYDSASFRTVRAEPDSHQVWIYGAWAPACTGVDIFATYLSPAYTFGPYDYFNSEQLKNYSSSSTGFMGNNAIRTITDPVQAKATMTELLDYFDETMLWFAVTGRENSLTYPKNVVASPTMLNGNTFFKDWYWIA